MTKRRRSILAAAGGVAATLAGCVDGDDGDSERNRSNRSVSDALPEDDVVPTVDSAFPQYQSDAGNTGAVPDGSGPTGAIESLFEFGDAAERGRRLGSPSVADGAVYVTEGRAGSDSTEATTSTTTDGRGAVATAVSNGGETAVVALDAVDGATRWAAMYPNAATAGATAVTDEFVLAGVDGSVVALDPVTGDQQWAYACGRASDVTVTSDAVYVVGTAGGTASLYSLAAADGSLRWERDIDAESRYTTPAVTDDSVYVGGAALQAFDAADGTEQWRTDAAVSTAPAAVDDSVVVGSEGSLRVYDTAGVEQWSQVVAGVEADTVSHSPAVGDGTVYLAAAGGVGAYDLASGDRRYRVDLGMDGTPVVVGDFLYLFDAGQLACLAAADGVTEWTYGTGQGGDPGDAAPAVVDGVAYFPAERLYAIA